ncbi:DgyrCDS14638 [Dimorphilus gyrociliatus]|uniref:DgyrCDS14638 n=1 Tax=Dimorphilus gyrociliatus TaxID=2664684 RepID=A0A7I8WEK8_9ANNE|nr:DgyrCDS14638 [Dimorphilus gyrociliatus]
MILLLVIFFLFSSTLDSTDDDDNDENLVNIASLELGATCQQSSNRINHECSSALDTNFQFGWTANCGGHTTCLNEYIIITFSEPARPLHYCYINRLEMNNYVKKLRIEWTTSGFVDTLENLPSGYLSNCFNYEHEPTIEYSVKVILKEFYGSNSIGFTFFKVFAKRIYNIYDIQFVHDVVYHLPIHFQPIFNIFKLRVQGQNSGNSSDCSSLIISMKNDKTKQFSVKLDTISNNVEKSSIEIFEPEFRIVEFSNSTSLISCELWTDFWLKIAPCEITFGLGKIYDLNKLVSVKAKVSMNIHEILFKNGVADIINQVQMIDIDQNINFQYDGYYENPGNMVDNCKRIKSPATSFDYKIFNGTELFTNNSKLVLILKEDGEFTGKNVNIFISYSTKEYEDEMINLCDLENFNPQNSFLYFYFQCKNLNNHVTDVVKIHILLDIYLESRDVYFCKLFFI